MDLRGQPEPIEVGVDGFFPVMKETYVSMYFCRDGKIRESYSMYIE